MTDDNKYEEFRFKVVERDLQELKTKSENHSEALTRIQLKLKEHEGYRKTLGTLTQIIESENEQKKVGREQEGRRIKLWDRIVQLLIAIAGVVTGGLAMLAKYKGYL